MSLELNFGIYWFCVFLFIINVFYGIYIFEIKMVYCLYVNGSFLYELGYFDDNLIGMIFNVVFYIGNFIVE